MGTSSLPHFDTALRMAYTHSPAPGVELAAWRKANGVRENPGWGRAYDSDEWWKPLPPETFPPFQPTSGIKGAS